MPDENGNQANRAHGVPAPTSPPIHPIATQCRLKGVKLPSGQALVAVTMLTALGSATYFFEPEVMEAIGEGMKRESFRAQMMPTPVQAIEDDLIVPGNN
jgi:hypothetical protein